MPGVSRFGRGGGDEPRANLAVSTEPLGTNSPRPRRRPRPLITLGWRERLKIVDPHIGVVRAKVDTGARTSSLRATRLKRSIRGGTEWIRFTVPADRSVGRERITVECPILDERLVRSSNGQSQLRPVISASVRLNSNTWRIELTLARREDMTYDMLLGRTALRGRFVVDPAHSFTGGLGQ